MPPDELLHAVPLLKEGTVRQVAPDTLTVEIRRTSVVKLSVFWLEHVRRVNDAETTADGVLQICIPALDIAAFKVAVLPQRSRNEGLLLGCLCVVGTRSGFGRCARRRQRGLWRTVQSVSHAQGPDDVFQGWQPALPERIKRRASNCGGGGVIGLQTLSLCLEELSLLEGNNRFSRARVRRDFDSKRIKMNRHEQ